jgi:hypothetical protein
VAESQEDWYAATFHRAWAVKGKPDSAEDRSALQTNYEKLRENNPNLAQQLRHLLPAELADKIP